jgi:hypothetical protein
LLHIDNAFHPFYVFPRRLPNVQNCHYPLLSVTLHSANASTHTPLFQQSLAVVLEKLHRFPDSCVVHTLDVRRFGKAPKVAEREMLLSISLLRSKYSGVQSRDWSVSAQSKDWRDSRMVGVGDISGDLLDDDVFAGFRCLATLVDHLTDAKACSQ